MRSKYKKEETIFEKHQDDSGIFVLYPGQIVLKGLLDYTGLSLNAFSKYIGLDRAQKLYDIRDGKTRGISAEIAIAIYDKYPDLNLFWILTANGEMLENTEVKEDGLGKGVSSDQSVKGKVQSFEQKVLGSLQYLQTLVEAQGEDISLIKDSLFPGKDTDIETDAGKKRTR